MLFNSVHHIAIICSDYQKSKHFYTEVLGFKIIHETYREHRLSYKLDLAVGGNIQIELFFFPNPPKRISGSLGEACGLRHLAFAVTDIDVTVKYLQAFNIFVEPIRVDEYTGKKFTFFADPDGLPLEIYSS